MPAGHLRRVPSEAVTDVFSRCQEMAHRPPDSDPKAEAARWREVARLAMALAHEQEETYQKTLSLVIPGDIVRDLSPNTRLNWRVRAQRTKLWREKVTLAWLHSGRWLFKTPVNVTIIVRRGRIVDTDNLQSACKSVRDGLWGEGCMLHADDKRYIASYEVVQETGRQWREAPEVEILVTGEPL